MSSRFEAAIRPNTRDKEAHTMRRDGEKEFAEWEHCLRIRAQAEVAP